MFSLLSKPPIVFFLLIIYQNLFFGLNFKLTYSQSIFDFFDKLTLNEPLPSVYYLFWINLNYLPSFFFLFGSLIFLLLLKTKENLPTIFILVILICYLVEVEEFLIFNIHTNYAEITSYFFNNLLTNELNKYHPPIFYTSVIFFTFFTYQTTLKNIATTVFNTSYILKSTTCMWLRIIGVNLVALSLGGWWALQEGTWGGWWNWDPSETLGLLVTLAVLLVLHYPSYVGLILQLKHLQKLVWYLFVLTYFFIQLNFEIVSHNFNFKPFFFFNSNVFLLQIIVLLGLLVILKPKLRKQFFSHLLNSSKLAFSGVLPTNWFENYCFFIVFAIFYFIIALSLTPIVNYFVWNFFKLSVVYQYHQTSFLLWLLTLLIFSRFVKLIFSLNQSLYIFLVNYVNFMYFFIFFKGGRICILHFLVYMAILINYIAIYNDFLIWVWSGLKTNFIYFSYGLGKIKYSLLVLNGGSIDQISFVEDISHKYIASWSVAGFTNQFEIGDFLLLLFHSNLFNLYYTSKDYFSTGILMELHNLNQLLFVLIFLLIYFYKNWGTSQNVFQFVLPTLYYF